VTFQNHVMRSLGWVAVACVAGCDALAGDNYVGTPLISLSGSFASPGTGPGASLGGVALEWQDPATPNGPGIAVTVLPVAIAFPDAFRVDVPTPPPQPARFALGGIELAEAYVDLVADASVPRPQPCGRDRGHALVYASEDVPAGSLAADYLGGPVAAGYHLRSYAATTTPGAAQQQMIARCTDWGAAAACQTQRAYQLGTANDTDPLVIDIVIQAMP
jgi:hypothetical protein